MTPRLKGSSILTFLPQFNWQSPKFIEDLYISSYVIILHTETKLVANAQGI